MKQGLMRTERLELRALGMKDYLKWFEACVLRDPKKTKWDVHPLLAEKCSKEQFRKGLQKSREAAKRDDSYWYGVFEKKSGKLIGHIDFTIYARGSLQFAGLGYRIYNGHWGQGYGREAARASLMIGFQLLHLNRIEAAINLDNRKSILLAKSIGMKREGIKKKYWFENGKWVDHLIYVANPEDLGLKASQPT